MFSLWKNNKRLSFALVTNLALVLVSAGCSQSHLRTSKVSVSIKNTQPIISWSEKRAGGNVRHLFVYKCTNECPELASLPSYPESTRENALEDVAVPVWKISGVCGVEKGTGAIQAPVAYGVIPESPCDGKIKASLQPQELTEGHYLAQIVVAKGSLFKATYVTGWASFSL